MAESERALLQKHQTYNKLDSALKIIEGAIPKATNQVVRTDLEQKRDALVSSMGKFKTLYGQAVAKGGFNHAMRDEVNSTYSKITAHIANPAEVDKVVGPSTGFGHPIKTVASAWKGSSKVTKTLLGIGGTCAVLNGLAGLAEIPWVANTALPWVGGKLGTAASFIFKEMIPGAFAVNPLMGIATLGLTAVAIPLAAKGIKFAYNKIKSGLVNHMVVKKAMNDSKAQQAAEAKKDADVAAIEAQLKGGTLTFTDADIDMLPYNDAQKQRLRTAIKDYEKSQEPTKIKGDFETEFKKAVTTGGAMKPISLASLEQADRDALNAKKDTLTACQVIYEDVDFAQDTAELFALYEKKRAMEEYEKLKDVGKADTGLDLTAIPLADGKTVDQLITEAKAAGKGPSFVKKQLAGFNWKDIPGKTAGSTVGATVGDQIRDSVMSYIDGHSQYEATKAEFASANKNIGGVDYSTLDADHMLQGVNNNLACFDHSAIKGKQITESDLATAGSDSAKIADILKRVNGLDATEKTYWTNQARANGKGKTF